MIVNNDLKIAKLSDKDFGKLAERHAVSYFTKKSWKIIDQNFRCEYGEIDLIAKLKNQINFIEVKARRSKFIDAKFAVNAAKQNKILSTASFYIDKFSFDHLQPRFDVLSIYYITNIWEYDYTPYAF